MASSPPFYSRHPRPSDPPRSRLSISSLPQYSGSSSAVQEKYQRHSQHLVRWWIPVALPIPGVRSRRLRVYVPNVRQMHHSSMARFGRKRGSLVFCVAAVLFCFVIFAVGKRFGSRTKQWPTLRDPPTLVFKRDDIQRIWEWEVKSGHYPSRQPIPVQVRLKTTLDNPALPPRLHGSKPTNRSSSRYVTDTNGIGPRRVYLRIESEPPNVAYPPRPVPGSVADLDVIMEHCDFSDHKYVRDCLEVLRVGSGLDNGKRVRRTALSDWKYIYVEQPHSNSSSASPYHPPSSPSARSLGSFRSSLPPLEKSDLEAGLVKKWGAEWEAPMSLPAVAPYTPSYALDQACNPEQPRIFHMFWTGRFTDKPYLALLSFLYTQNLGLHKGWEGSEAAKKTCRPQFWLWINPGPAAAVHNPNALSQMYEGLKESPWASPFLHPRFKDVIKFKLWNTTEMLDGIDELKDEWRGRDLFNSGGWVINVPKDKDGNKKKEGSSETSTSGGNSGEGDADGEGGNGKDTKTKAERDDLTNRAGSKSASSYDRLSVILSDMARFILCHRFGGIYLDADTIFLRDWSELLSYSGAFAYRWSRLPLYNTAVLKLNKGSALGSFLFRTSLRNNLDFHPMTVSRYVREAGVEEVLRRLPDALFDSAWLNTEDYQMDRPPQPFFTSFEQFFDPPSTTSGSPAALGFDGFFKGAYSYHFHNFWWKPFDPARNWPDLGPRFAQAERRARKEARDAAREALAQNTSHKRRSGTGGGSKATQKVARDETRDQEKVTRDEEEERWTQWAKEAEEVEDDVRDLSWSTVLKRTFEGYLRGERPNMYGEWLDWGE